MTTAREDFITASHLLSKMQKQLLAPIEARPRDRPRNSDGPAPRRVSRPGFVFPYCSVQNVLRTTVGRTAQPRIKGQVPEEGRVADRSIHSSEEKNVRDTQVMDPKQAPILSLTDLADQCAVGPKYDKRTSDLVVYNDEDDEPNVSSEAVSLDLVKEPAEAGVRDSSVITDSLLSSGVAEKNATVAGKVHAMGVLPRKSRLTEKVSSPFECRKEPTMAAARNITLSDSGESMSSVKSEEEAHFVPSKDTRAPELMTRANKVATAAPQPPDKVAASKDELLTEHTTFMNQEDRETEEGWNRYRELEEKRRSHGRREMMVYFSIEQYVGKEGVMQMYIDHCAQILQKCYKGHKTRTLYAKQLAQRMQYRRSRRALLVGWKTRRIWACRRVVSAKENVRDARTELAKCHGDAREELKSVLSARVGELIGLIRILYVTGRWVVCCSYRTVLFLMKVNIESAHPSRDC